MKKIIPLLALVFLSPLASAEPFGGGSIFNNNAPGDSGSGGGSGTVTSASVVSANGLAGTVANPTTTPAITLSTTVTGVAYGNGTTLSAATAAQIVGAFSGCSGTQYLGADGACHSLPSSGVSTFTGDGIVLSNSASTGSVTATLENAPANTVFGNNTGSNANPGYYTSFDISSTGTAAGFISSIGTNSFSTPFGTALTINPQLGGGNASATTIQGGSSTGGTGGALNLIGGFGDFQPGGAVNITGGTDFPGQSQGGSPVNITGGIGWTTNNAGNVVLTGGPVNGSGKIGQVVIASSAVSIGSSPTIASNACGSTTQGTVTGTDNSMIVTVGTASVTSCAISFATSHITAPKSCSLTPANTTAAATGTTGAYIGSPSTAGITINGTALATASYTIQCW